MRALRQSPPGPPISGAVKVRPLLSRRVVLSRNPGRGQLRQLLPSPKPPGLSGHSRVAGERRRRFRIANFELRNQGGEPRNVDRWQKTEGGARAGRQQAGRQRGKGETEVRRGRGASDNRGWAISNCGLGGCGSDPSAGAGERQPSSGVGGIIGSIRRTSSGSRSVATRQIRSTW